MPVAVACLDIRGPRPICGARDLAGKGGVLDSTPDKDMLPGLNVGSDLDSQAC